MRSVLGVVAIARLSPIAVRAVAPTSPEAPGSGRPANPHRQGDSDQQYSYGLCREIDAAVAGSPDAGSVCTIDGDRGARCLDVTEHLNLPGFPSICTKP